MNAVIVGSNGGGLGAVALERLNHQRKPRRVGVGRLWWAQIAGSVRPSTVVVPDIFREHSTQMPLIEDQYAVGEFGFDRAHEPVGETVRPRTTRRYPDHADAHIGQHSIE